MTDHFDKWINGMSDEQYEDWLEDDATEAQEEKALNIRTPVSEREEEDLDEMQRGEDLPTPELPVPRQVTIDSSYVVTPKGIIPAQVIETRDGPPIVVTKPQFQQAQSAEIKIERAVSTAQRVSTLERFRQSFSGFTKSLSGLFRRKK